MKDNFFINIITNFTCELVRFDPCKLWFNAFTNSSSSSSFISSCSSVSLTSNLLASIAYFKLEIGVLHMCFMLHGPMNDKQVKEMQKEKTPFSIIFCKYIQGWLELTIETTMI